jgi:glycerate dehydrogenase
MKKSAVLVNEARGAVLNEKDVTEAVKSGRIAAFGCDVYSSEPFPTNHPYSEIKNFDNVILTPHAAWASYEARERCVKTICENIKSFFGGGEKNRIV